MRRSEGGWGGGWGRGGEGGHGERSGPGPRDRRVGARPGAADADAGRSRHPAGGQRRWRARDRVADPDLLRLPRAGRDAPRPLAPAGRRRPRRRGAHGPQPGLVQPLNPPTPPPPPAPAPPPPPPP